jgi:hypothetical protein
MRSSHKKDKIELAVSINNDVSETDSDSSALLGEVPTPKSSRWHDVKETIVTYTLFIAAGTIRGCVAQFIKVRYILFHFIDNK